MSNSIWIPESLEHLQFMAEGLENDPIKVRQLVRAHAALGHHFDSHVGRVLEQTYSISGKPSLKVDSLAAIVRKSGLARYIRIIELNAETCTYEVARNDEPEDIVHRFTFNQEMRKQMGLRGSNWERMPVFMLRARCLGAILRQVFPDAVAGCYSVDEMIDSSNLSDQQQLRITAESFGEDLGSIPPQQHQAQTIPPQQPQQPQQLQQPQRANPPTFPPPLNTEPNRFYSFDTQNDWNANLEALNVDQKEIDDCIERNSMIPIHQMSAAERERFFYGFLMSSTLRTLPVRQDWYNSNPKELKIIHASLVSEYPILMNLNAKVYGPKLKYSAYHETLKLAANLEGEAKVKAINTLTNMHPAEWTAYDLVKKFTE